MSDILIEGGSFQVASPNRYEIDFSNAADIILPFQGTIVIPRQSSDPQNATPDIDFSGMYRMMFMSLLYPSKVEGANQTFPFLRDINNRPITVSGPCLFLVADDTSFLDDIDIGQLFDDPTELHNPAFQANTALSSSARYLLIQFESPVTLPGNLLPFSRKKAFKQGGNTDSGDDQVQLQAALSSGNFSGKVLAFDLAGHQTEALSSLKVLGVDKPINGEPNENEMRVQFVNSHGAPLGLSDFPLNMLDSEPPLSQLPNTDGMITFSYNIASNENLKLKMKSEGTTQYKDRFHHVGFWPGYGTQFNLIKEGGFTIKPFEGIEGNAPKPRFMRLALFHPADEFQDSVGGDIEVGSSFFYQDGKAGQQAVFKDNGFQLFTARNQVTPMNTGEIFNGDYYDEVSKLKSGDKLFQANWIANSHFHLKGSMASRLISPSGDDPSTVHAVLEKIRDNSMIVPLDVSEDVDSAEPITSQNFVLLPKNQSFLEEVTATFAIDIETNPLGDELPEKAHRGFVRAGSMYGWKLHGEPALIDHSIYAFWKNDMKLVRTTSLNFDVSEISELPLANSLPLFKSEMLKLDIDESDPPKAILKRIAPIDGVEGFREWLAVPTTDEFNYQLMVINLDSGFTHFVPLNPANTSATDVNLELINLGENETEGIPGMTGDDKLVIAIVNDGPQGDFDFTTDLVTSFKTIEYSDQAHISGNVPRLKTEYGGLLRNAIANGVEVRALKWDHILNNLGSGPNIRKGHTNNQQIVATINRSINNKRGFAFIDQSTRELGAWHQKPAVIMKKVPGELGETFFKGISYLGGYDMALGRWDGDFYYKRDPDRQKGPKYDVQVKIDGEASWDVLRNFHHRWKGIDAFLQRTDEICQPRNHFDDALWSDVQKQFSKHVPNVKTKKVKFPKSEAFVQVNRTIPPFSCFAGDNSAPIDGMVVDKVEGELGSRASYLKGIANAHKFIMINEQYFFSPEIAKAVRDSLLRDDGPDFAIIVLPNKLSESEYIDPLFFKLREKMLDILRYGYTLHPNVENPSGRINSLPQSEANPDISDRIALLTPANHEGAEVYCHSKQILIDDIWMTIGSANMSNRGLTYEGEINAAFVGQKLYKGGSSVVREQRIELSRRLLGLPKAYKSVLHDPFAMFRLLKKIEAEQDSPSQNIYPLNPLVKWLDPHFRSAEIPGDSAYNSFISFVATVDVNDPSFNFWIGYFLDADGRNLQVDRLGYLARMLGLSKHPSFATGTMDIQFDPQAKIEIEQLLTQDKGVVIKIFTTIISEITSEDADGNEVITEVVEGPFLHGSYPLAINGNRVDIVSPSGNSVSVPISLSDSVKIEARCFSVETKESPLKKGSGPIEETTDLDLANEYTFDPKLEPNGINLGDDIHHTLLIEGHGRGNGPLGPRR